MKKVLALLLALPLVGCASYGEYYSAIAESNIRQAESHQAQAEADKVRYGALMRIAESGDSAAKVAAVMALAIGQNQGSRVQMVAPAQPQNEALQWASILVPGVTQGLSIYYNAKTTQNASDNATRIGLSTNATFGQFASEINDPTVVTQPAPFVVTQPAPIIVEARDPVIVDPVIVYQEVAP